MTAPERFNFLGEDRGLDQGGWDAAATDKLWRYNLHYFADLTAVDAKARAAWHQALLMRWVRENPPGVGTGWEPFPTSLRIVNWIKYALAGNELPDECVQSLAVQTRWLSRRLERHLLGNHLFANAKALFFAGTWFGGAEADGWLALAASILRDEVPEQILLDGGHFERSTMYHALAVEDVLDLCNVAGVCDTGAPAVAEVKRACRDRIPGMRHWLTTMTHPDGEIAFFNDAAVGIAPAPGALETYARRLGLPAAAGPAIGLTQLASSGYVRIANRSAVALVDVAPVGPDYLPGHAHADTLSFELSLFGHRVIVNSGTSRYGVSEERLRQRGTAAHNTVMIDGADSSEVWSGFRVGHRARPLDVRISDVPPAVEGAHDGYCRLPGAPVHRRRWTLEEDSLSIEDRITGEFGRAESRLHLHPDIEVPDISAVNDIAVRLRLKGGRLIRVLVDGGTLRVEPATWHPRFGQNLPTSCLVTELTGAVLRTRIDWSEAS